MCAHPQDLPSEETYLAVFENMDTVVFFNAQGRESRIWQQLTGAALPSRNIEGAPLIMCFLGVLGETGESVCQHLGF